VNVWPEGPGRCYIVIVIMLFCATVQWHRPMHSELGGRWSCTARWTTADQRSDKRSQRNKSYWHWFQQVSCLSYLTAAKQSYWAERARMCNLLFQESFDDEATGWISRLKSALSSRMYTGFIILQVLSLTFGTFIGVMKSLQSTFRNHSHCHIWWMSLHLV